MDAVTETLTGLTVQVLGPIVGFLESLSWMGVLTHVVKVPMLDEALMPIADGLQMDLTLIKYTVALFAVYPLAAVLYALPGTQLKHAFSAVTGLCLVQWIFGPDWIHSFVTAVITYLLCLVLPRKSVGTVAFYFVMAYMTGSHMYRMYISYMSGTFDFTGTQMVLTMKLTSFAYNLGDGGDKMVLQETPHEGKMAKVYADRARFAVRTMPSPLAYLGYVYCFTCILAGPAFEYKDYERAIDGDAYKTKDGSARKPPTLFAGLLRLLVAVLCLGGHLQLSAHYSSKSMYDQTFIDTVPYFARYAILMVAMFSDRLKFYFAWKIAEGASILGGFGFEGYTDEGKVKGWKGVENIDIRGFETATCVQSISKVWNKRTQGWLERYTYHRSGRSLTATYFVSAIWHGLYPGFFIMFMTIPLMTNVERLLKSKINPLVVPGFDGYDLKTYPAGVVGWLYWGVCWLCTMAFMNYVVQVFSMGSLENSLTALSGHWFLPHLVLLVAYVLLEVMPATKKVAKDKKA